MSAHLDSTYGAAFIGMVVAAVLYGVSCVQAFFYYTTQNDRWHIKHSVTAVMILETVHQALITHTVYTYTITDWGNPERLPLLVWSLLIEVIVTAITALIVQCFLTLRIWRLSNQNIYISGTCVSLAFAGFIVSLVYVAKALTFKTISELAQIKAESLSVNIVGAVTDLLIAGTLCALLNYSRTGFQRSDAILNKLILFSVNTGLITSLCALSSLISILAAPDTFIYIAFFFCLGRLYTNSLLATLNARKMISGSSEFRSEDTMSVLLRDLPKSQPRTISVKMDTTRQELEYNCNGDQKVRVESSEAVNNAHIVPYGEENSGKSPLY